MLVSISLVVSLIIIINNNYDLEDLYFYDLEDLYLYFLEEEKIKKEKEEEEIKKLIL